MASYQATEAPVEALVPRQRGSAALGLAAMAVGATTGVIGLADPATAAERAPVPATVPDAHAPVSAQDLADAGSALLDRLRTQTTAPDADSARVAAAQAATAKARSRAQAEAAEAQAAALGQLTAPLAGLPLPAPQAAGYWSHLHTGVDLPAPAGSLVQSVGSGTIVSAGWAGSYGYRVIERLGDGTEVWYCHLSAIAVGAGQMVPAGQVLGRVGAVTPASGPQLHLEIRPDGADPVEPLSWLSAHGAL
jgi:murein DD-endopeptidase MepM/ murein hydrolase activator NlpD